MPPRGVSHGRLSREARKHLLRVACTVDRIDLVQSLARPPLPVRVVGELAKLPWAEITAGLLARALPWRRGRMLYGLWRTLRNVQRLGLGRH